MTDENPTTLRELQTLATAHRFIVRKTDGEYRIAPRGPLNSPLNSEEREARAYYTDDFADAVSTLRAMIAGA